MRSDPGSSTVLISGVVGLIATVSVATAGLGLAYGAKTQAQNAADAAALAAAVATYPPASDLQPPRSRALMAAGANGARLVSCVCRVDGSTRSRVVSAVVAVEVEVPVFGRLDVRATSRAEFDPRLWLGR